MEQAALLIFLLTYAGVASGSIANLIVVESARDYGVVLRFGEHAKAGIP